MMLDGFDFSIIYHNISWVGLLGAALLLALSAKRNIIRRYDKRIDNLRLAQRATDAHQLAMKSILKDANISEEMKRSLVDFSGAFADRRFAFFLIDLMNTGALFDKRVKPGSSPVYSELRRLRKEHPSSAENIEIAIETGVVALFLMWPETAKAFSAITTMMSAAKDRDIQVMARTTDFIKTGISRSPDASFALC